MLQYAGGKNAKLYHDEMLDYTRKTRACPFNHKQTHTRALTHTLPESPTVVVIRSSPVVKSREAAKRRIGNIPELC